MLIILAAISSDMTSQGQVSLGTGESRATSRMSSVLVQMAVNTGDDAVTTGYGD